MDIEELQKEWGAIKSEPKTHDELRRMMYQTPLSRLKRLTRKERLRLIGKSVFIAAVIVGFDLFKHWSSGIFALWTIVLFIYDNLGLRYLRIFPGMEGGLHQALTVSLVRMQRVVLVSRLVHGLIWLALVLVLGLTVPVGSLNILLWALMLLPLLVGVNWWTSRNWSPKIAGLKETLREFSEEETIPNGFVARK